MPSESLPARAITTPSPQDAIAMIVNDLIVVGALPQVVNAYWAVGDTNWMRDKERAKDLIKGWGAACEAIGATWGGGETPTLKDIVTPGTIDIGGAAVGIVNPKEHLVLGNKLAAGDAIVLIKSSGIHANGITFIRGLAEKYNEFYQEKLSDGRTLGEALLTPTYLYIDLVKACLEAKLDLHYMVNITGHGWRKLMRAVQPFTYVINELPPVPAEFTFIQEKSGADDQEMYGNFNMGAGFAIYLPKPQAQKVVELADRVNLKAWINGEVQQGSKEVLIKPKAITFAGDTLEVRVEN
jgi:phosphoribosylformylglycinamidine cyclo-ligase